MSLTAEQNLIVDYAKEASSGELILVNSIAGS
jgi:hypothetical protein